MDFIERIFGIAPDGGSGLTEFMVVIALAALVALGCWRWRSGRSTS
ncbi:MAG TPA: hypothetical protein VGL53_04340 [Bryobacteraceae bacterium]|jgi:hypothetical protein